MSQERPNKAFIDQYLYFGSAIMLVTYFVNFRLLNYHLFGKELFIRFTASAFRKLPSIYVFSYFPFGFEGRMWDLIVSVPDHCLSFHFEKFSRHRSHFKRQAFVSDSSGSSTVHRLFKTLESTDWLLNANSEPERRLKAGCFVNHR